MTFKIITLGCKINSYESQAIREELLFLGYREIDEKSNEHADYTFINTCAVTNQAERKCTKLVHHFKKTDSKSKIVVFGCSSQIHQEYYIKEENVVAIFGANKKEVQKITNIRTKNNVKLGTRNFDFDDFSISKYIGETRAVIKIQDGCDNFCSYCIVPYTRGKSRSRSKEKIFLEIEKLLNNNFKELIISGIDVSSYQDPSDENYNLVSLLKDILNKFKKYDFRIRVSSIEISRISDDYIALFKDKKMCPHFHVPLQSASPKILKLMNRRYDLNFFSDTIKKIRSLIPNVAFSTDVICGFPFESDLDFDMTYKFLKDNLFMRIHAFPYSERPFTKSLLYNENSVDMSVRKNRVRKIIKLSEELDLKFRKSLRKQNLTLLIDYKDDNGKYVGFTENYLEFKISSSKNIIGQFINIDIDL